MSAPRNPTGPATGVAGSLPERTVVNITRGFGKPTSGRVVYRDPMDQGWSWPWHWQCDLHNDDDQPDQWGTHPSWSSAMEGALRHAAVCPFVSASVHPGTLTRPRPTGS